MEYEAKSYQNLQGNLLRFGIENCDLLLGTM